ncbi:hypothetical protein HPP92_015140 [Vanilla planifolia]|uniref:Pectinesterase inhibitor domain-containing protein n=1 Tax=Vanilla planifolia TaxID=51239 RepID=A0A835QRH8_VANPL|nr:hypothetical protein HPP92_015140 [Vanilla planifolia]
MECKIGEVVRIDNNFSGAEGTKLRMEMTMTSNNDPTNIGLLLLLLTILSAASATGPEGICNSLGGGYVTPDYCISVLGSDPRSRTADDHGLAVIADDIALANATGVNSVIITYFANVSDSFLLSCLNLCRDYYVGSYANIRQASNATSSRDYATAEKLLNGVFQVPAKCEETFTARPGVASLLNKEDSEFSEVVNLARGINNYLKKNN